jgi:hypothetical protein
MFIGPLGRGEAVFSSWWFFDVLLVFFGNAVDGGFGWFLGDFFEWIHGGRKGKISPALKKFPAREKKKEKEIYGEG